MSLELKPLAGLQELVEVVKWNKAILIGFPKKRRFLEYLAKACLRPLLMVY